MTKYFMGTAVLGVILALSACKVGNKTYTPVAMDNSERTSSKTPASQPAKAENNNNPACDGVVVERTAKETMQGGLITIYAMYVRNESGKRLSVLFDIKYSEKKLLSSRSWFEEYGPAILRASNTRAIQFVVKKIEPRTSIKLEEVTIVRCDVT
jgi:hypothetical protein